VVQRLLGRQAGAVRKVTLGHERAQRGRCRPRGVVVTYPERPAQAFDRPGEVGGLDRCSREPPVAVARGRSVHAGDLHEAAERDCTDPVLDAATGGLDDGRRKPDVELPRPHAEGERGHKVAQLVHEDKHAETDNRHEETHAATILRSATRLASSSAATSSSRLDAGAPPTCSSVFSTVAAISRNASRPSRNAATATSLAAL